MGIQCPKFKLLREIETIILRVTVVIWFIFTNYI